MRCVSKQRVRVEIASHAQGLHDKLLEVHIRQRLGTLTQRGASSDVKVKCPSSP